MIGFDELGIEIPEVFVRGLRPGVSWVGAVRARDVQIGKALRTILAKPELERRDLLLVLSGYLTGPTGSDAR